MKKFYLKKNIDIDKFINETRKKINASRVEVKIEKENNVIFFFDETTKFEEIFVDEQENFLEGKKIMAKDEKVNAIAQNLLSLISESSLEMSELSERAKTEVQKKVSEIEQKLNLLGSRVDGGSTIRPLLGSFIEEKKCWCWQIPKEVKIKNISYTTVKDQKGTFEINQANTPTKIERTDDALYACFPSEMKEATLNLLPSPSLSDEVEQCKKEIEKIKLEIVSTVEKDMKDLKNNLVSKIETVEKNVKKIFDLLKIFSETLKNI